METKDVIKEKLDRLRKETQFLENKMEEQAEDLLPTRTVNEVKKRPLFYIISLIVLILVAIGLSTGLVFANKSLGTQKNAVADLNLDLQKKADELTILQNDLNQTEEGKKQVEAAKAQSDANAATAQQQASTAQAEANQSAAALSTTKSQLSSVQNSLNSTNSQLNAAQSSLSSTQAALNTTNAQLSSAKACVSLFSSVNSQINSYGSNMNNALIYGLKSGTDGLNGNYSLAISELNSSQSYFNTANGIFPSIQNTLNRVGSGNCN